MEDRIEFKFQRLIPIWTKTKTIKFHEIRLVEYFEGKASVFSIIINLIAYIPGTIKPDDEIIIELANGESFRHERVGTKKQFLSAIELIKTKIKNAR